MFARGLAVFRVLGRAKELVDLWLDERLDSRPGRGEISVVSGQAHLIGSQLGFVAHWAVELGSAVLGAPEGLEDGEHAIVVGLRERFEFVIVAASAAERDSQKRSRGRAENVVELIVAVDVRLGRLIVPCTQAQKCGGDLSGRVGPFDFVAGQLLGQESAVRLIMIEGADDVVAISPGVWFGAVTLVSVGLGEADDVEPVASRALAKVRAGEKAIDQIGGGVG